MFADVQVEFLEDILSEYEGIQTIGAVSGFISAMLCSPLHADPRSYAPILTGSKKGEDSEELITLLGELQDSMEADFSSEEYEVLWDMTEDGSPRIDSWVIGFNLAMTLAMPYWEEILNGDEEETVTGDLAAVVMYGNSLGETSFTMKEKEIIKECKAHIEEEVIDIVLDLYDYSQKKSEE